MPGAASGPALGEQWYLIISNQFLKSILVFLAHKQYIGCWFKDFLTHKFHIRIIFEMYPCVINTIHSLLNAPTHTRNSLGGMRNRVYI